MLDYSVIHALQSLMVANGPNTKFEWLVIQKQHSIMKNSNNNKKTTAIPVSRVQHIMVIVLLQYFDLLYVSKYSITTIK